MKAFTTLLTAAAVATTALALPEGRAELEARFFNSQDNDPQLVDVTVVGLPDDYNPKCGKRYSRDDVYKAVQWSVLIKDAGLGRGRADSVYPQGRFPHSYVDQTFTFAQAECAADENRQEYPLKRDDPFNGSLKNRSWGDDRVVYYREPGEIDENGNPKAYFCGTLTHEGALPGKFKECET